MSTPVTSPPLLRQPIVPRVLFAVTTCLSAWLLMQVVHECGHVAAAYATGGRVQQVVLVPWEFSRTDLAHNPNPLVTCWGGPLLGAALPLLFWLIALPCRSSVAFWLRFFAGFCLIANGAYISFGSIAREGDAGDLLRHGGSYWTIGLFGIATIPAGFLIWHRLDSEFGWGANAKTIHGRTALWGVLMLLAIVVIEILASPV